MNTRKRKFDLQLLVDLITWAFGLLFLYAAISKLMDYKKFVVTIGQSAMLTDYASVLAWAVPLAEIIIAIMLVFKRTVMPGLFAAFSLMVMFTAYIFIVLQFSDHKPCACGGVLSAMSWSQHLVFNGVFVGLGVLGIVLQHIVISTRKGV